MADAAGRVTRWPTQLPCLLGTAPCLLGTALCLIASDLHHALSIGGPCSARHSARASTASLRAAVPSTDSKPATAAARGTAVEPTAAARGTAVEPTAAATTGLLTVLKDEVPLLRRDKQYDAVPRRRPLR